MYIGWPSDDIQEINSVYIVVTLKGLNGSPFYSSILLNLKSITALIYKVLKRNLRNLGRNY